MPIKEPKWYDNYTKYLKDVVYIVGILVSLYGWITTKSKNEAVLETTIKYNTETVKKLEIFVDKQIELNAKQAELDGQYSQFVNSHKE